jgi:hypothetical protein
MTAFYIKNQTILVHDAQKPPYISVTMFHTDIYQLEK